MFFRALVAGLVAGITVSCSTTKVNSSQSCPGSYSYDLMFCWKADDTKDSWDHSETRCRNSGRKAHLTSIGQAFENEYVRKNQMQADCDFSWIGGVWDGTKIKWADGSVSTYTHFAYGVRPSESGCVAMDPNGNWYVRACDEKHCSVCKEKAISDCADWKEAGYNKTGLFTIAPYDSELQVWCDMETDGGGWTVFQNRVDGKEPFWNRTWTEYKNGFGEKPFPFSNFHLGMDNIHYLTTKDNNVSMRVDLWGDRAPNSNYVKSYWFGEYTDFSIDDEQNNYILHIKMNWQNVIGNASAQWYDITYNDNQPFSTVDRINDPSPKCVTDYHLGGWWLHNCAFSSLNGEYRPPISWGRGYGMFWLVGNPHWHKGSGEYQYEINPKKSRMMLRRSNFKHFY